MLWRKMRQVLKLIGKMTCCHFVMATVWNTLAKEEYRSINGKILVREEIWAHCIIFYFCIDWKLPNAFFNCCFTDADFLLQSRWLWQLSNCNFWEQNNWSHGHIFSSKLAMAEVLQPESFLHFFKFTELFHV